jgi:hypothetical protein
MSSTCFSASGDTDGLPLDVLRQSGLESPTANDLRTFEDFSETIRRRVLEESEVQYVA